MGPLVGIHRVQQGGPEVVGRRTVGRGGGLERRRRVTVEAEPLAANLSDWLHRGQFRKLPGGVEVHARGQVFHETVELAGGDPWSDKTIFTDDWLRQKFVSMTSTGVLEREEARRAQAEVIIALVDRLEELESLDELTEALGIFG